GWAAQSSASEEKGIVETQSQRIARLKQLHLDQIQLTAEKFIALENKQNNSNWQVTQVNLKTLVPKCAEPLTAGWAPNSRVFHKSVAVYCAKSVSKDIFKTWEVYLPVTIQKPQQEKTKLDKPEQEKSKLEKSKLNKLK
ncbi:MAG: hypothetical protein ABL859_10745, partial [Methylotenera sp.]